MHAFVFEFSKDITLRRMASWRRSNNVKRNVSGMVDTNAFDWWKDKDITIAGRSFINSVLI